MDSSTPFPDEAEMKDRSSSPITRPCSRRSGRLAAKKRASKSAMDDNAITRKPKRERMTGRKRKRSPSASESALSSATAVAVRTTKPSTEMKDEIDEKIPEVTLSDLVARLHLEGQKDRPELVPVYPPFMTQIKKKKKKKKTRKHLPIRLARNPQNIETRKLEKFVVTVKKLKDKEQDEKWKKNAKYTFNIECLEHKDTKERWLNLKDLLLGFGYGTRNNHQRKARAVYHESLITWLHMNFLEHPTECFVRTFGPTNDEYLSKEGFTMLVSILNSYERTNNMVAHINKFRFQYIKAFYKYDLVKKPRNQEHGHDFVCTVCCMEDLKEQFEYICDCNHATHLRCPDQPAPPKTDEQKRDYFCCYCKNTFPDHVLEARRRNHSGEFEIERILGFSESNPEIFPGGAYLVIWKFFPLQACEFLPLQKSFAGAVQEFWNVQRGFERGLMFKKKHQKNLKIAQGKLKPKADSSTKKGRGRGRGKQTGTMIIQQPQYEKDEFEKIMAKLGKEAKKMVLHHLDVWQEEEKFDIIDHSIYNVALGGKKNVPVPHFDLPEAKDGEKYIPVKLWQVTDPKRVIRNQRLTQVSERIKYIKQAEYLARLVRGRNRDTNLIKLKYNGEVPRRCLESSKEKHFNIFTEDFGDQINELMTRDWSGWDHDTSHRGVTIGAIIDPDNPASKYTDQKVGKHVYGLFACDDIEKGQILCEYVGVCAVTDTAEAALDHVIHELDQTTLMDLTGAEKWKGKKENYWGCEDDGMVVDPHLYHNEAIYMNDFRDNIDNWQYNWGKKKKTLKFDQLDADEAKQSVRQKNVEMVEVMVNGWPHVFCVSMRDIECGEELLTDYGAPYWVNFKQIKERIHVVEEKRKKDRKASSIRMKKQLKKVQGKIQTYDEILEYCRTRYPDLLRECETEHDFKTDEEKGETTVVPTASEVEMATEDVEMSNPTTTVEFFDVDNLFDEEFPVVRFEGTGDVDVEMGGY